VTVQLLHLADLHFGALANLRAIAAVEKMIPDLRPDAVVVAGDLTQRARHGEFQRAQAFTELAAATAPVYVMPGNHDVRWWARPLTPFGKGVLYSKYERYFGADLAPTLTIPGRNAGDAGGAGGAVIAGALTSHGAAWGSLTFNLRDLTVKGHLPAREMKRVREVFTAAPAGRTRVLVVHHNVLRGEISRRMGLARWRRAQRRILESGAEIVLCGHDHQEGADVLGGRVVVSTASTLCTRVRAGRAPSFNFVTIEPTAVHVTFFRWEAERGRFKASDTFAFARPSRQSPAQQVQAIG